MNELLLLIPAVLITGFIVWLGARVYFRGLQATQAAEQQEAYLNKIADLEGRAQRAEALAEERRQEVERRDAEVSRIRDDLARETETRARLEESLKYLQEERERLEALRLEISETFKSLSYDALSKNSAEFMRQAEEFIKLAEEKLKSQTVEGRKDLDAKKELIDQNIETIGKTLSEVQRKVEEVGSKSGERLTEVTTLIKKHEEVTTRLRETTDRLGHALASAKKRGEWGERMAEDILRLVGMVEGVNYSKQKTLEGSSGRPDYTFFLPHNLKVNMDVKFPMDNYLHYVNAESEHDRRRYRDELLKNTRVMIRQVTTRDYINPSDNTVDYVIVFIPNEQVYGFINEADPTILDDALRQKVILCSPFTLYAVLAVMRQAVENFNLEQTASEILKLLADFSKQWNAYKERFRVMGERLDGAKKEYDALVTTRSSMLERSLKRIEDLRKQKAIGFEEEMKLDETALL